MLCFLYYIYLNVRFLGIYKITGYIVYCYVVNNIKYNHKYSLLTYINSANNSIISCQKGNFMKINKSALISIALIIAVYAVMQCFGITCPIKYITGISCAGCGMTRAWIALLHLDFSTAFMYHPLFFLPPLALILFLCRAKLNKKVYYFCWGVILAAFIIVYLYRMIYVHDDIVVFEPQNNIIFRTLRNIMIKR